MARLGRGFPNNALMRSVPYVKPSVLLDSVGAGSYASPAASISWSHTIGTAANLLVVGVNWVSQSYAPICEVGTTSMTKSGSYVYANASGYVAEVMLFTLFNPPAGAQTITFSSSSGGTAYSSGNSVAYTDVSSLGTISDNSTATVTVSSAIRQRVVNLLGGWQTVNGQSFTGYNQNALWTPAAAAGEPTILGDAPGAPSVTFTATNNAVNGCGSMALPLLSF